MTQDKLNWLDSFHGRHLGFQNYEILTIQHIPKKERMTEAELMRVKWFDYRQMHPMRATYHFVKCYTVAYQNFTRKNINADTAPFVRCIAGHDFLEAREKLSIWRLRQLVDRLGMPYDFFLEFSLGSFYKMVSEKGKIYAPRPSHLMGNEEMIANAVIAWEERCASSLQIARNPYYRVSNFDGHDNQIAHEAFIVEQIKQRRHQQYALHAAMYLYDAVRLEEALRQFDLGVVKAAIDEVVLID